MDLQPLASVGAEALTGGAQQTLLASSLWHMCTMSWLCGAWHLCRGQKCAFVTAALNSWVCWEAQLQLLAPAPHFHAHE
jgi:hypothetical protein